MSTQRAPAVPVSIERPTAVYRPELDALRFIAFMSVFSSHSLIAYTGHSKILSSIRQTGNFGVPVFFTLSAYLITDLLLRERTSSGTVCIQKFYIRRILRIWPLYLGILLIYALLGRSHHAFYIERGRIIASLFMAGNWYMLLHPAITTPLRALWSISVEEQFYLLWPLAAKYGGTLGLKCFSLALFPAAMAAIVIATPSQWHLDVTIWLNSFVQFQFLAVGALLAIALRGDVPVFRTGSRMFMMAVSVVLFVTAASACHIKRPQQFHSVGAVCAGYVCLSAASALLLLSFLGLSRRLVPSWAAWLGRISFGLYVLHETGFLFADEITKHLHLATNLLANKLLAFVVTMLLATLSWNCLEKPFLKLKNRRFTLVSSRQV